ncbi:MAG: glutamate--tRNA ligase [Candidatus Omnitrophica bacterium]|jgi:glutamyl/glutaminyl-tRNA synthetase|nr:glutamate--tRNA ligase [Candidatus Omnitrophota bacterium]
MKSTDKTIVRFAPSPTGYLHIGGARTCLFNWLYARHTKGKFILRIEDTDLARSKQEYLDEILESIKWLGMDFDEIYYQSKRFGLYRDYAQKLIDCGRAYKKDDAVFFKYDFANANVEIDDLIRGKIVFNELPKEEEVIIKKDGTPTYNFSCCIDDALMEMSLIIRGEDHISNTPKQILMYKALGFSVPQFAHVPLILSEEGGRMSKRYGATSIREYKEDGYLSCAIANYLLLLSWSPGGNREIITLSEAKDIFEIKKVNKTAAAFSMDKLNWMNSEYIKKKSPEEYLSLVEEYLKGKNFLPANIDKEYAKKVFLLFKDRLSKLSDLFTRARFCFYDDYTYDEDTKEILARNLSKEINILAEKFSALTNFNHEEVEQEFRKVATDLGLKTKELVHPVRVALSGKKVGPSLFETMEVLGKERVVAMLKRLIDYWGANT